MEKSQETAPLDATEPESVESVPDAGEGSAPATDVPRGSDEGTDEADGSRASREAAKYRRQLREVEGERDALRSQVENLQRSAVAASLPSHVTEDALWSRTTLGDLVDETGAVSAQRVAEAVRDVETAFKIRPRVGPRVSIEGRRSNSDGRSQPGGLAGMARAIER